MRMIMRMSICELLFFFFLIDLFIYQCFDSYVNFCIFFQSGESSYVINCSYIIENNYYLSNIDQILFCTLICYQLFGLLNIFLFDSIHLIVINFFNFVSCSAVTIMTINALITCFYQTKMIPFCREYFHYFWK